MPVKSFFIPKTALQGEEIPVHAIWEGISYHAIRIEPSPLLQVKEVYNAQQKNIEKEPESLLIKKLEVEGYLGLILKAEKLESAKQDTCFSLTFLDQNEEMIESRQTTIHLFRPNVVVEEVPDVIEVDMEKRFVHSRIKLHNAGDGTAVVVFLTRKDSEVKKTKPQGVRDYRKMLNRDLKRNLANVQAEYPKHSELVGEYVRLLRSSSKGKRYFQDIQDVTKKILGDPEEDFVWAFIEALGSALLKNIRLVTIVENFLDYLNSIATKKVLVYDPIEVVPVSTEPQELAIDIWTTDLLVGDYPKISLPKTKIVSNQKGEVEIHRLFEWK
jgi:hypothetical protein